MKTDNELIAEFMGFHGNKLIYDTSWDWLVKVLERIESKGYDNAVFFDGLHSINERNDFIIYKKQGGATELIRNKSNTKIKAVYGGVVSFIRWYNSQNKKGGRLNTMRLPKVNPVHLIDVIVQRTGMIETKNALLVRCVKQVIEGITIPQGYEIWLPNQCAESIKNRFSSRPIAYVPGWKINEILRTFYIDQLRDGKTN